MGMTNHLVYIDKQDKIGITAIQQFLLKNHLLLDERVEFFVTIFHKDKIIACGGLHRNVIKCLAVDESTRGENLLLSIITELVHKAYELNRFNLFIYTKPEYQTLFQSCGFYPISESKPHVVLLENSRQRLAKTLATLALKRRDLKEIGSVVMNANPFTLGHRYLIEKALEKCDHLHLFVVGEDLSLFSYEERFHLVKLGIEDLKEKITLHRGCDYIISNATFPNYFIKDEKITEDCYCEIDLQLFRKYIAPALGIHCRFVGEEPFCGLTHHYNQKMHSYLENESLPYPPIKVIEIKRKQQDGHIISASYVRALLKENHFDEIKKLVPATTFDYLIQKFQPSSLTLSS